MFNNDFIAHLLISLAVKEFLKSISIWRSYAQNSSVLFLVHRVENCPRSRIEVPMTAFRNETLILTLTSDLDFQSRESYGHDLYTCKRSRSEVARYKN